MTAMLLVTLLCTGGTFAYSVLTHEEIVDLVWTDELFYQLKLFTPAPIFAAGPAD
jgi:hypothetical protein